MIITDNVIILGLFDGNGGGAGAGTHGGGQLAPMEWCAQMIVMMRATIICV